MMPTIEGHCSECGVWYRRYVRPERKPACLECAIRRSEDWNRAMAAGTHPHLPWAKLVGAMAGHEIRERSGPIYEKWRNRLRMALDA